MNPDQQIKEMDQEKKRLIREIEDRRAERIEANARDNDRLIRLRIGERRI